MEEKKRTKAEYRSSLRSKRLIREALITMMREKPFDKITITDIVKAADINRGTFYAHFKDTEEVLESIRNLAIDELKAAFNGMTPDVILANPRPLFEALTELVKKDKEYYRLIFDVESFKQAVLDTRFQLIDYFMNATAVQNMASSQQNRAKISGIFDFLITGIIGTFSDVLKDNISLPYDYLPELLTAMTGGAIRQVSELIR
ncbi:MAG: TetR family transcriptional regulator [Spirochaetes bacterium]|uniref:TetR family transcriptional regulator n=1 Tax=Candidatus Ornithospirochaeta stercoripullorum TaxID=2840899 RepID=A0A9D9DZQ5_9SPIO|nr:TetR family transcriptional regulator [Candidatus Ornithospirochaeta stercoripullorum]